MPHFAAFFGLIRFRSAVDSVSPCQLFVEGPGNFVNCSRTAGHHIRAFANARGPPKTPFHRPDMGTAPEPLGQGSIGLPDGGNVPRHAAMRYVADSLTVSLSAARPLDDKRTNTVHCWVVKESP